MVKLMRILFLCHRFYPDIGGTEFNSEFLAKSFHDFGAEVHLLTWTKETGEKSFPFQIIRSPSIKILIDEHKWADLIFENSPTLRLSWPNYFMRKPSAIVLNTWFFSRKRIGPVLSKIKKFWLSKASTVIAVSNAIKDKCWPNAIVIHNAYNDKLFVNYTNTVNRHGFVFLGRLVSDKGADFAISAIHSLMTKNVLAEKPFLTIIGTGPDLNKLKDQVTYLKLQDYVSFTGVLTGSKLVAKLNEHKYLLVPSIWEEPFGIVALEGMACGCYPIVADSGGLGEAIGDCGFRFCRGSFVDLVEKMLIVIQDKSLIDNFYVKSNVHLKSHTMKTVATKYFEVLQSIYNTH